MRPLASRALRALFLFAAAAASVGAGAKDVPPDARRAKSGELPWTSLDQPSPTGQVSPAPGPFFSVGTRTRLQARASHPSGISHVAFFVGATQINLDDASPFDIWWTPQAQGFHDIWIAATSADGYVGQSVASRIAITSNANAAPVVAISSPQAGQAVSLGQSFTITATASDPNGTVASVAFFLGGQLLGTDTTAPYSTAWTPTRLGPYAIRAVATDNAGTSAVSAPIVFHASNNQLPSVSLTSPATGTEFFQGQSIAVAASASDSDGSISRVDFFANGALLHSDASAPYTHTAALAVGQHAIHAVAFDNQGASRSSATSTVTVKANQAPTVALTSPANNTAIKLGQAIGLSATASDDVGIAKVDFVSDTLLIASDSTPPYAASFTPTAPGVFAVRAIAHDVLGATSTSSISSVRVVQAPSVAITGPTSGGVVETGVAALLSATASTSTPGGIARVEFFVGATSIAVDTTSPYTAPWTPASSGSYSLSAKAFDVYGVETTSASVAVTASNRPTVNLSASASGVTLGQGVALQASASDADGSIARVEFHLDGGLLASDTTAPFSHTWVATGAPGTRRFVARAFDNHGLSRESAAATVTTSAAPSVAIATSPASPVVDRNQVVSITATPSSPQGSVQSVKFFVDGALIATDEQAPYQHAWSSANSGSFSINARVVDGNGFESAPSSAVTVVVDALPTAALSSPGANAVHEVGKPLSLTATVSDPDGTIANVEFLDGAAVLGTDAAAPYAHSWTPMSAGSASLRVRVTDHRGRAVVSASVPITVASPPQIAIAAPSNGAIVKFGDPLTVNATVTGASADAQVRFFAGSTLLATDAEAPYSHVWSSPSAGEHAITATVVNGNGLTATSSAIGVVVNRAPVVTVAASPNRLTRGQSTDLVIQASDADGTVASIQVHRNGALIHTDSRSSFTLPWSSASHPEGEQTFTVVATDNRGTPSSEAIAVVAVLSATSVQITSPQPGDTLPSGAAMQIRVAVNGGGGVRHVEFFSGSTSLGRVEQAPYSFNWSAPTSGAHALVARLTDSQGAVSSSAPVNVVVNTAPTVQIAGPGNNTAHIVGEPLEFSVSAADSDGTVQAVEFYRGEQRLSTDTTAPYSHSIDTSAPGPQTLKAKAIDNLGQGTWSPDVTVLLHQRPTVALVAPSASSVFHHAVPISVSATASDSDGIKKVEFLVDGVVRSTDEAAPFAATLSGVDRGARTLTARATDTRDATQTSAAVPILVNGYPQAQLTRPTADSYVEVGDTVTLEASASDIDGHAVKVEFLKGQTVLASDSSAPYTFDWTVTEAGDHAVSARAVDEHGATYATPSKRVVAGDRIRLTVPAQNRRYTVGTPVALAVEAHVPGYGIRKVQYFANGEPITGEITAAPYTASWTPSTTGTFAVSAKAWDASGSRASSATMSIGVTTPPSLDVAISAPHHAPSGQYVEGGAVALDVDVVYQDGPMPPETPVTANIYDNGQLLVSKPAQQTVHTIKGISEGAHTFAFSAFENVDGTLFNVGSAQLPTIRVNPGPRATLELPRHNIMVGVEDTVAFRGTVQDDDGVAYIEIRRVKSMEAFLADNENGTVVVDTIQDLPGDARTRQPFAFDWKVDHPGRLSDNRQPLRGAQTLVLKAYDNIGAAKTVSIRTVIFGNSRNAAPTLHVDSPPAGYQLVVANEGEAGTVRFSGRISDQDGYVDRVDIINTTTQEIEVVNRQNFTPVGVQCDSGYQCFAFDWLGVDKTTTFKITAIDDKGTFSGEVLRQVEVGTIDSLGKTAPSNYAEDHDKRIKAAEVVGALGDTLFGEEVNFYTGATTFSHTDLEVPGNSSLPVRVGRRFSVAHKRENPFDQPFGDWDLDVPYMSGTFPKELGWRVSPGGMADEIGHDDRCSRPTTVEQAASPGATKWSSFEIWHGNSLYVPGHGEQAVLFKQGGVAGDMRFKWVTKSLWRIECLGAVRNEEGEGFIAHAPDGTRYFFDVGVRRAMPPLYKFDGDRSPRTIERSEVRFYASKVVDRFGNEVHFNWEGNDSYSMRLMSIVDQNERDRRIDFHYGSDNPLRVSRVVGPDVGSADDRPQVSYEYSSETRSLNKVVYADRRFWALDMAFIVPGGEEAGPSYLAWDMGSVWCAWRRGLNPAESMITMTHPTGAQGEFRFRFQRHIRSGVSQDYCLSGALRIPEGIPANGEYDLDEPWDFVSSLPRIHENIAIDRKSITGAGLPDGLTWRYGYDNNVCINGNCPPAGGSPNYDANDFPASRFVTVAEPGNLVRRFEFGRKYNVNEGQLLGVALYKAGSTVDPATFRPAQATLVQQQRSEYVTGNDVDALCQDAEGCFEDHLGKHPNLSLDNFQTELMRPLKRQRTTQDGVDFTRDVLRFNRYAEPERVRLYSALAGSATPQFEKFEQTEYVHDHGLWVLNQPLKRWVMPTATAAVSTKHLVSETRYDAGTRLPEESWAFGRKTAGFAYQNGLLTQVTDAAGRVTRLDDYRRGVPRLITLPPSVPGDSTTAATLRAVVDAMGRIRSATDENNHTTQYDYDAGGRLRLIDFPDTWDSKTFSLQKAGSAGASLGLTADHWVHRISQGSYRKEVYLDAYWRPVLTHEYDATSPAAEARSTAQVHDERGLTRFVSYPQKGRLALSALVPTQFAFCGAGGGWSGSDTDYRRGQYTHFDALGRVAQTVADSEDGGLCTQVAYLPGFIKQTRDPRGTLSEAAFRTFDAPDESLPVRIVQAKGAPEQITTLIDHDVFGKTVSLRREGSFGGQGSVLPSTAVAATRKYRYDLYQRLCLRTEPETGVTAFGYDAVDNLVWSADGVQGVAETVCDTPEGLEGSVPSGLRTTRSYDGRNRLDTVAYPAQGEGEGEGAALARSISHTYYPDGALKSVAVQGGAAWNYTYNSLGLVETESATVPGWTGPAIVFDHDYTPLGHRESLAYPGGFTLSYAPNVWGQPKQVSGAGQSFAQAVTYGPTGAVDGFTFGNGVLRSVMPTVRGLTGVLTDSRAGSVVNQFTYDYDRSGNVLSIADGKNDDDSRSMVYDALNRLTRTDGTSFGYALYEYDPLDNLRRAFLQQPSPQAAAARDYRYQYENVTLGTSSLGSGKLDRIDDAAGAKVWHFGYDTRGNVTSRNGGSGPTASYTFDAANRLVAISGNAQYRYDGHGRRVRQQSSGKDRFSLYTLDGVYRGGLDATAGKLEWQVHLGSSLIATHSTPVGGGAASVRFHHTDALGSPVVETGPDGLEISGTRTRYSPYGEALNRTIDGPGYTGHVMDGESGLVYMQQRFYDPVVGRFLGVDPVVAEPLTGGNFNRYWYANNNPYTFTDPDGRWARLAGSFVSGFVEEAAVQYLTTGTVDVGQAATDAAIGVINPGKRIERVAEALGIGSNAIARYKRSDYRYNSKGPAAKAAREAGEGQSCSKCGETMVSGTNTAPQAQHTPPLSQVHYEGGGANMTSDQKKEYANSPAAIGGADCQTCQRREGGEQRQYVERQERERNE